MIMFLSSDGLAEFKDRECPGQQEAGDYSSPWLPRALRPLRPVGRDGTPAGKRAADPAKGCRQMSKDPVTKTKDVRAAVDAELGFDPLVDTADVTVRNLAGDVTLTGTVPSYPQYLEAAAATRRGAGVTGVHNNLMVVLPDRDYRDDIKLATAANNALAANVTVPDSVEAIAEDGNIILTGTASYGTELSAAEAAVAVLAGVRSVSNDIEIIYGLDPVEDDLHVQQALGRAPLVPDDSDVTADTKDGIITLTGHVRTWAEHDAVFGAALMARGVVDIRDELEVTG